MSSQGNPKYALFLWVSIIIFKTALSWSTYEYDSTGCFTSNSHSTQAQLSWQNDSDRLHVARYVMFSVVMMFLPILWAEHDSCSKESLQYGWYQHSHQNGSRRRLVLTLSFFWCSLPNRSGDWELDLFKVTCIYSDPISKESLGMTHLWKGHLCMSFLLNYMSSIYGVVLGSTSHATSQNHLGKFKMRACVNLHWECVCILKFLSKTTELESS